MSKKSSEYWQQRFKQIEESQHNMGLQCYADIEKQYRRIQHQLETQINAWYGKFATNNGITLQEAKSMLINRQLEELKWDINQYITYGRENAVNGQWMKQLENASARYHISRLEALKLQTQQSLEVLFDNQLDSVDRAMRDIYTSGYYHTAYEIQKGIGVAWNFATLDDKQISKVLYKPWAADGKDFSSRIWTNKIKLVNELNTTLTQNIILGRDPQKAIDEIARKMKVSKTNAGRLVMTEEAFFSSAAQKDCFKELDVEQYEIVVTLDSHTSDICRNMDGQHFNMSQWEVGVTAPPFHVNCRTTTIPYFDDEFDLVGERAARGEDGKTYYVSANMKYEDWQKSFVEGDKTGLQETTTNDTIKDKVQEVHLGKISNNLTDIQQEEIKNLLIAAPKGIRNTWENCYKEIVIINPTCKDTPHYSYLDKGISIDTSIISNDVYKDVGEGEELYRKAYNELFHECGHAIDNIAGRNISGGTLETFYSETFISGKYKTTLGAMLELEVMESIEKFGKIKMTDMLLDMSLAESVDISDIFGAFTQNTVVGLTGHDISYWTNDVYGKAAKEAFAEIYSAELSAPDSLQKFKQFFPKSYDIFNEMLENIAMMEMR